MDHLSQLSEQNRPKDQCCGPDEGIIQKQYAIRPPSHPPVQIPREQAKPCAEAAREGQTKPCAEAAPEGQTFRFPGMEKRMTGPRPIVIPVSPQGATESARPSRKGIRTAVVSIAITLVVAAAGFAVYRSMPRDIFTAKYGSLAKTGFCDITNGGSRMSFEISKDNVLDGLGRYTAAQATLAEMGFNSNVLLNIDACSNHPGVKGQASSQDYKVSYVFDDATETLHIDVTGR